MVGGDVVTSLATYSPPHGMGPLRNSFRAFLVQMHYCRKTFSAGCILQTSKVVDSVSTDRRCQFDVPASSPVECAIEGVLACKVSAAEGKVGKRCSLW